MLYAVGSGNASSPVDERVQTTRVHPRSIHPACPRAKASSFARGSDAIHMLTLSMTGEVGGRSISDPAPQFYQDLDMLSRSRIYSAIDATRHLMMQNVLGLWLGTADHVQ